MNDFLARTEEGAAALTRAVSETFADVADPARRTPRGWRRFAYLALGESTVWSRFFGWKKAHAVTSAPLLPLATRRIRGCFIGAARATMPAGGACAPSLG